MTSPATFGGQYQSQETRALRSIDNSKYPDTNKDLVKTLRRHGNQIDYMSKYLSVMQKGVDQANRNAIEQVQDFIADVIVLLGGGTIPDIIRSIAMGDLQYILPALGALFGFDEGPFPINLFNAAQKFFLGYVVPLPQFTDVILDIIWSWGSLVGLDPEFIENLRQAFDAISDLFGTVGNFVTEFTELFDLLGIVNGDLGPFSALLSSVLKIFQGVDLEAFGSILDLLTDVLNPVIIQLTEIINTVNEIIQAFSGGLTDLQGLLNFAQMFTGIIDFMSGGFDPTAAWASIITNIFNPLGLITAILDPFAPLDATNLFNIGELLGSIGIGQLGTGQQELLDNGSFREAISVSGGGIWTYYDTQGRTVPGSAKVTAASVLRQLMSNSIRVEEGDKLHLSIWAKWASLAYTGSNPIKLQVVRLMYSDITQSFTTMGTDDAAVFASPGANQATWLELSDDYTVPAGCSHVALQLVVAGTATAGDVWWDDGSAKKTDNAWLSGITDNFTDLFDGLLEFLQVRDILGGGIVTPINGAVQEVKDWISGMADLFSGNDLVDIPSNPVAGAMQDFMGLFFRGGTQQVVTQNRVAEPSGIPPMDSATKIPWVYLPPELMTTALGMPWVQQDKPSNQSIGASSNTLITWSGGTMDGPTTLTFTSNKFKLPFDGMWNIEIYIRWNSFTATQNGRITLEQNGTEIRRMSFNGIDTAEICTAIPAATTDEFGVFAYTDASSKQVNASGTMIRATYMGMTTVPSLPPPPDPVTIDSFGAGDSGHDDAFGFNHTFGPNANAIFLSMSQEYAESPVVTVGGISVPVVYLSSLIGTYFGFQARHSVAAAILPTSVRGTTKAVSVTLSNVQAFSVSSISFNNANSMGTPVTNGGTINPAKILVPGNTSSKVGWGFGGHTTDFGSVTNGTQTFERGFTEFVTWAHLVGHGNCSSQISATPAGRWSACGIEFHA